MSMRFAALCKVHCHDFSRRLKGCFLSFSSLKRISPSCPWLTMCWLQTASTSALTTTWHTPCSDCPTPARTSRRWASWRGWGAQQWPDRGSHIYNIFTNLIQVLWSVTKLLIKMTNYCCINQVKSFLHTKVQDSLVKADTCFCIVDWWIICRCLTEGVIFLWCFQADQRFVWNGNLLRELAAEPEV